MPAHPRTTRPAPAAPVVQAAAVETITSAENRWLKRFRAALRGSAAIEEGWVGVEGIRLVEDALRAGVEVSALLFGASADSAVERLVPLAAATRVAGARRAPRLLRTSDRLFAAVSGTETPQGVAALVRPRASAFDDLLGGGVPLVVVFVEVQDPGNVGTALRSAEAFGATGAITTRGTAYPWSPKVLRASAASALRLPILAGMASAIVLAQLRVSGLKLFAASADTGAGARAVAPAEADFREPCAILIGNEGAGLPADIERSADARVRIPITSPAESLNAAVAASVLLYEAARQRGGTS